MIGGKQMEKYNGWEDPEWRKYWGVDDEEDEDDDD